MVVADPALSHQLSKVLRMNTDDKVILFDGDGFEYFSTIASLRKDGAVFHIDESSLSIALPKIKTHLYPALIKKDKLEWVLQKATELGVESFHPVVADRSEKLGFDIKRAEKIIKEAAEQSGWGRVPEIFAPEELEMAIEQAENSYILEGGVGGSTVASLFAARLAVADSAQTSSRKQTGADLPAIISICVGPEGGWSENEKEYFSARIIPALSLGEQTLRAETASVAAAALFNFL